MYTTPGYQTINGIQTDNMCAKQCSQRTECKSFDYCANTQKCQLRKTHKLDMPNNTITTQATCNHYSRKFDYLTNAQICQLKETHIIPINTITTQATCNHYSHKFVFYIITQIVSCQEDPLM